MTKFQYTYNSNDIDVAHITIDDVFDINLIHRETGIEIDVLDCGDTCPGSLFVNRRQQQEVSTMVYSSRVQMNEIKLLGVERHRNGISGAPFELALFDYDGLQRLAVVFDTPYHCAVLDLETISRGNLQSRWRGDAFEEPLRTLIKIHL